MPVSSPEANYRQHANLRAEGQHAGGITYLTVKVTAAHTPPTYSSMPLIGSDFNRLQVALLLPLFVL
jgi:hypothetical protein